MANTRTCIVCGKQYKYCSNCNDTKKNETWRNIYDTDVCRQIFDICSSYENNKMSKGDALVKLSGLSLPGSLNRQYRNIVNEITKTEKKSSRRKKTDEEPLSEVVIETTDEL